MNADKRRSESRICSLSSRRILALSASICVYLWLISSCSSKPTDLRTLAPAETLVYLETNDLGAALQPIIDSKPFTEAAKSKPDLSALKGVQLAVAVTGFETSEEQLTNEHSVGKIQPHFIAIADTHAWHFQAVGFAEKKIGSFVAKIYDSEPKLEQTDKNGGRYFTWTAADGRKAYALVIDSLIYFTNDETAIDNCLAVRRGETDSVAKNGKVRPADPITLASGYISPDGVAQIANLAALKFASDASDESEVQSAVAGILPQLIRGTVTDVTWAQTKTDAGIVDKWQVNMPPDVANVFNETMASTGSPDVSILDQVPNFLPSITIYDLKNPRVAWRSLVLVAQKQTDPGSARVIAAASSLFFEPYGIADGEKFLSAAGPTIVTAKTDKEDDGAVVAAKIADRANLLTSLRSLLRPKTLSHGNGRLDVWQSDDGEVSAFLDENSIVLGETESLLKSVGSDGCCPDPTPGVSGLRNESGATSKTVSTDVSLTSQIANMLSGKRSDDAKIDSMVLTETRFNKSGMERKTTSDFGFIGWIIAQLNDD